VHLAEQLRPWCEQGAQRIFKRLARDDADPRHIELAAVSCGSNEFLATST
jgi:hypothetical protein